jgi:hypothetical protein
MDELNTLISVTTLVKTVWFWRLNTVNLMDTIIVY